MEIEKKSSNVLWAVWAAMFQSVLLYLGIGYLMRKNGAVQANGNIEQLTMILAAAALAQTAVNFLVLPKRAATMEPLAYWMMRWAFAEAIGIYGLVLFILGAPWVIFGAFAGAALALLILLRPAKIS